MMSDFSQAKMVIVLKEILETLKKIQSKQDWFIDQINDEYNQGEGNV